MSTYYATSRELKDDCHHTQTMTIPQITAEAFKFASVALRPVNRINFDIQGYIESLCRTSGYWNIKNIITAYFIQQGVDPADIVALGNILHRQKTLMTYSTLCRWPGDDERAVDTYASLLHGITQLLSMNYKMTYVPSTDPNDPKNVDDAPPRLQVIQQLRDTITCIQTSIDPNIRNKMKAKRALTIDEVENVISPLAYLFNIIIIVITSTHNALNLKVHGISESHMQSISKDDRKIIFLVYTERRYYTCKTDQGNYMTGRTSPDLLLYIQRIGNVTYDEKGTSAYNLFVQTFQDLPMSEIENHIFYSECMPSLTNVFSPRSEVSSRQATPRSHSSQAATPRQTTPANASKADDKKPGFRI